MKKLLAAAACALPFVFGTVYAQGTKGPSGSGAQNPSEQSRKAGPSDHDNARSATPKADASDAPTSTPRPGDQGSATSVAPSKPSMPSTTEPGAGRNRSASGDSTGPEPRRQDE